MKTVFETSFVKMAEGCWSKRYLHFILFMEIESLMKLRFKVFLAAIKTGYYLNISADSDAFLCFINEFLT